MTTLCLSFPRKRETLFQEGLITLVKILVGSLIIALCAQIRIPLPFTPVPINLSTLGVALVAGTLGARLGALTLIAYISEATLGLPVLAGLRIDPLALVSPVAGYLIGYVFLAYLVGWFIERAAQLNNSILFAGLVGGYAACLLSGAVSMAAYFGWQGAFWMGVIPFIPGELIKIMVVLSFFKCNGSQHTTEG